MIDDLPLAPAVPLWTDLYLKFDDEQAAHDALVSAGIEQQTQAFLAEDGTVLSPAGYAPLNSSVDHVGLIYKPTGETITTDMGEQPEMAALAGWHVNVRLAADQTCPASLVASQVTPAVPVRVWA